MNFPSAALLALRNRSQRDGKVPGKRPQKFPGRIVARQPCGVKRKDYKELWYGCDIEGFVGEQPK